MDGEVLIVLVTTIMFTTMLGSTILGLQYFFYGKVSTFQIALLSTYYWGVAIFASPIWGMLSDKTGRRKIILAITTFATGITLVLYTIFKSYWQIAILRALTALFASAYLPVALAILTENVERKLLGRVSSLFNLSRAIGFFISGFLVSAILIIFDELSIFFISALIMFFSSIVIIFLINENRCSSSISRKGSLRKSFLDIPGRGFLSNNRGHLLVIALALRHIGLMGMYSIIFVYLTHVGISKSVSSAISSFNTLTQILLMGLFGYLADLFGRKKVFVLGFLLSALVPVAFMFSNDVVEFSLSFILLGISFAALISGITPFLREISPSGREAEALSFLNISRGVGFIIGPILAGYIVDLYGYRTMFLLMATISSIGVVLSLFVKESLRK